jgi:glyceraldehyde 3-phosphate dehydrogenase
MAVKVGINGFGEWTPGHKAVRSVSNELDVVTLNDIGDMKTMAHLLRYVQTTDV